MKQIGEQAKRLIKDIIKQKNPILAELVVHWPNIVGAQYSANTYPLKIISTKENGEERKILVVVVENAALSFELSFQQDTIKERIAIYLGYRAIHNLRTVVR